MVRSESCRHGPSARVRGSCGHDRIVPGHYAYDPHLVTLLPGAPPGDYDVVVRLFVKDTLGLDSVLGPDGEPLGPDLVLGSITFARSKRA